MSKAKPTAENKRVARHAASAFGSKPQVVEYLHDTEPLAVDILWCENSPCTGVTAYSTIGLSDYPMLNDDGTEFPTRLEIAGACSSKEDMFANILASAAFCVMRTHRLCYPGAVMQDYVREYSPSSTVPHLYFTAPFLWEESLRTLDCGTKKVSWLLAMPISQAECQYLLEHGDDALETLLERYQIDIFDLYRPSVV